MRALVQRVTNASVTVGLEEVGRIGPGLVALLGIAQGDAEPDADYLTGKLVNLRIFADPNSPDPRGKFNLSALETNAELLVVSQFTLYAETRKGRRPSFTKRRAPTKPNAFTNT